MTDATNPKPFLLDGLKFAVKNNLSQKEIETVIPLLDKPMSLKDLASELHGRSSITVGAILTRLRLKHVVKVVNLTETGGNVWALTEESLMD